MLAGCTRTAVGGLRRLPLSTLRTPWRRTLTGVAKAAVEPATPSWQQLKRHALTSAVPMVGFGFMDNTVMLQMGNTLDCTIGVALSLSTLHAAAMGQVRV
ncbi:hypothetical protein T492DRAFT_141735 [Pavlovales sp. CCMP2436]|nr:hypothetical protein T492DRAFT_141735 [Pavlovales sp. CCMP2436]